MLCVGHKLFFYLVSPKGAFCFSVCPVYRGLWCVRSFRMISICLLFRFSVLKKKFVVVDVEIEPFAFDHLHCSERNLFGGLSFPLFVAIRPDIAPTASTR